MANAIKDFHFFGEPIPRLSHAIYIKISKLERDFGNQDFTLQERDRDIGDCFVLTEVPNDKLSLAASGLGNQIDKILQ